MTLAPGSRLHDGRSASALARWASVLLPLGVALALYAGALGDGFAFDDTPAYVEQPVVAGQAPWWRALTTDIWAERPGFPHKTLWRPLTTLSWRLDHALGGGAPWAPHAVNLALFLGLVLLVTLGLRRRLGPLAAGAAGLFLAAHPVFSEAVVSVVGRGELLVALLGLGGLLAARARPRLALALLGLGLFAKESGAAPLVAAVALALTMGGRRWRWAAWAAALAAAWAAAHALAVGWGAPIPATDNPLGAAGLWERVPHGLAVLGRYLSWWLVPQPLAADYGLGVTLTGGGYTALGVAGVLTLLAALWLGARRRWRVLGLGAALAGASLALLSGIFAPMPTGPSGRLALLPSLGLLLTVAAALDRAPLRRLTLPALALWGLAGAPATRTMVDAWRGQRSLFERSVALAPGSVRARINLAGTWLDEDPQRAAVLLRPALERFPSHPGVLTNLAAAEARLGHAEEAWRLNQRALALAHGARRAQANRCALALDRPQLAPPQRVTLCDEAWAAGDRSLQLTVNRARALAGAGRTEEAEALFRRALQAHPGAPYAVGYWVGFLAQRGRWPEAVAAQRAFAVAAPRGSPEAARRQRNLLALLLSQAEEAARRGDTEVACQAAREALRGASAVAAGSHGGEVRGRALSACPALAGR